MEIVPDLVQGIEEEYISREIVLFPALLQVPQYIQERFPGLVLDLFRKTSRITEGPDDRAILVKIAANDPQEIQ